MATVPTLPVIPAGSIPTVADMNNLAACVTFIYTKPIVRVHDAAGTQAIGSSFTTIPYNTADINNDGMWSSGANSRLTAVTPGWYKVRYSVVSTGLRTISSCVRSTTGANNPQGAGVQINRLFGYGYNGSSVSTACNAGIWPAYMYIGDYLEVRAFGDTTGNTTNTNEGGSFFSAELVSL